METETFGILYNFIHLYSFLYSEPILLLFFFFQLKATLPSFCSQAYGAIPETQVEFVAHYLTAVLSCEAFPF